MNNYRAAATELPASAKRGGARLRNGDLEHKLFLQDWHNTDKDLTIIISNYYIREKIVSLSTGEVSALQNPHLEKWRQQKNSHHDL